MRFSRVFSRPKALGGALLALSLFLFVGLLPSFVGTSSASAAQGGGGSGVFIQSVAGQTAGSGTATAVLIYAFENPTTGTITIEGGGAFKGGAASMPITYFGDQEAVIFAADYQCVPQGARAVARDKDGNILSNVVLNVGAGVIDANCGKEVPPADADGDGVVDTSDKCLNTPAGETVDENGCSASQRDSDGDGYKDNVDKCPNSPAGLPVDEQGCVTSLPPTVTLTGTIQAPSANQNGEASFVFTNPNEVAITYRVNVSGVHAGDVTLTPGESVEWKVDRPVGAYAVTLRAAGSVTNPVSFTITAKPAVVPTPKPTEGKPVVSPTPKPVAPSVPKPTQVAVPVPTVSGQPTVVVEKSSTAAAEPAFATGNRGGAFLQSVGEDDHTDTSSTSWIVGGALVLALAGVALLFVRPRKVVVSGK